MYAPGSWPIEARSRGTTRGQAGPRVPLPGIGRIAVGTIKVKRSAYPYTQRVAIKALTTKPAGPRKQDSGIFGIPCFGDFRDSCFACFACFAEPGNPGKD